MRVARLLLLLFIFCAKAHSHPFEFQYWQLATMTFYEEKDWGLYGLVEGRFRDNPCCLQSFFFSPIRFQCHLNKILDLELHYTFVEARDGDFNFRYRHRLEIELNPTWVLNRWVTFSMRNRYELIKVEEDDWLQHRLRIRPRLTFPWGGCYVESWNMNNEFFFNLENGEFVQNRFVPMQVTLKLSEKTFISPFIMWEARKAIGFWQHNFIVGSQVDF